jgi:cell wall-associated NlpC family hydrolase
MTALSQTTNTTEIMNEFVQLIDTEKEYSLKELKEKLTEVYKTKTAKTAKKTAKKTEASSSDDEEKPKKRGRPAKVSDKPKRAPSAYNKFVKERIEKLKTERPEVAAKDLMRVAASEWKELSKEDQESYK